MTSRSDESADGKIIVLIDAGLEVLIPGFLENRRVDLRNMREALAAADYETIKMVGHGMKGTGGGYGFDEITSIGRVLEDAADRQDAEVIKRAVESLESYLDRVEIVYE